MKHRSFAILIFLWSCCISICYGQNYSFIDTSASVFQHQGSLAVNQVYQQWQNRFNQRFTITQLGSEEIISQQKQSLSWLLKMQISPGVFFPSTFLGGSHPSVFPNSHTGHWVYATTAENSPLIKPGLCGYSARCDEANSSSITIQIPEILQKSSNRIRIYCERNDASFDLQVLTSSGFKKTVAVYQTKSDVLSPFVEIPIPIGQSWLKIQPVKNNGKQKQFTLHGISIENSEFSVWHAIGIRGISLQRTMNLDGHFVHLQKLNPSIIIFDALSQDFFRNQSNAWIQQSLRSYYQSLKRYLPKTVFVVAIPQEINRNQEPQNELTAFASQLRNEFYKSAALDWLVWDWHRVSGGQNASYSWIDSGLLKSNSIQLSPQGIAIKAHNLNLATSNLLTRLPSKSLVLKPIDTAKLLKKPVKDTLPASPIIKETWKYHIVKYGETAYRIASKYNISPNDLKNWNNLRGYYIYPGQKLKVGKVVEVIQPAYQEPTPALKNQNIPDTTVAVESTKNDALPKPRPQSPIIVNPVFPNTTNSNSPNSNPTPSNKGMINVRDTVVKPATTSPKYHKVQANETLYSISKMYGVSVDQIKRLNRLPNNSISIGRLLRVW